MPCCLSKDPLKRDFLDRYLSSFFGIRNFGNTSVMRNIKTNIFRIQAYYSIMCGYFCIGFICFMFNSKSLTDYTNVFSPNDFKKNDEKILNYFMNNT